MKKSSNVRPVALTVTDLASAAQLSTHIRCEIETGRLVAYRVGLREYRIRPEEYEAWRERGRVVPRADPVADALTNLRGGR